MDELARNIDKKKTRKKITNRRKRNLFSRLIVKIQNTTVINQSKMINKVCTEVDQKQRLFAKGQPKMYESSFTKRGVLIGVSVCDITKSSPIVVYIRQHGSAFRFLANFALWKLNLIFFNPFFSFKGKIDVTLLKAYDETKNSVEGK